MDEHPPAAGLPAVLRASEVNGWPTVSVVMPVYNGERYLREAINSVLSQTFADLELIVVDDGSTDSTPEILEDASRREFRLEVHSVAHAGQCAALNHGLSLARGPYVAIAHADDVSLPDRLRRQVEFMGENPGVGICGTWARLIGRDEEWHYPAEHEEIRCHLLFHSVFVHSSVMFRRSELERHELSYEPSHYAHDYDLWVRGAERTDLANLPEIQVLYRIHSEQVSQVARETDEVEAIHRRQLEQLGISPTQEEFALHAAIAEDRYDPDSLTSVAEWLERLGSANAGSQTYDEATLDSLLATKLYFACCAAVKDGPRAWRTFRRSPLSGAARPYPKLRLLARSLVRI
jgi:glycosyltransferase involved in cell wall biosynthesis